MRAARFFAVGAAAIAAVMSCLVAIDPAVALTIVPAYDSSIVNAPNASAIESSIKVAATDVSSLFSNPGTVNILFKYEPGSFLGQSQSSFYFDSYSTVVSELTANANANPDNTVLATALANLSSGNDANGINDILATSAEFRIALGDNTATPCYDANGNFVNSCNSIYDGVITISSSQPIDFTRPVPTYNGTNLTYDAVRIEEHEVVEVLGGGGSGTTLGSSDQSTKFGILDLFRYSANGTPSFTTAGTATSYFSVDGGATRIIGFNQDKSGDFADWGPSTTLCPGGGTGGPGFVQDAFSCNNMQADVTTSTPEYKMLEAIGYDPISSSPANITWDCSTNPDGADHTGSISAAKTSGCTQVVIGTNTYTGGTTIAAGTLQIGNSGTAGSIVGNVSDRGTLSFDRSDSITFGGAISGSGRVLQIGTGTTTLTGPNSYTGGTLVKVGTLAAGAQDTFSAVSQVSVSAAATLALGGFDQMIGSLTGSGNVLLGSAVLSVGTDNRTTAFSGEISGSGGFDKIGTGNLYLTGTNTYTGVTTISAGGLGLGLGGTTGSIAGNVVDNGSFYFDRSNALNFGGAISGSGRVLQIGTGTTTLTGPNSYTGGTLVKVGTLAAGAQDTFSAVSQVSVSAAATLALGGFDQMIGSLTGSGNVLLGSAVLSVGADNRTTAFSGVISGSGGFDKIGTGNLYLTGANTYTGVTAISAGGLGLGLGGTTGSIAGNVVDNAGLYFDRSNGLSFAGSISGSGIVKQIGTGTTTLSGVNTYTGRTFVLAGTLRAGTVNTFSAASNMIVNATGTIDLNGFDETIGSLAGSGNVHLGSAILSEGVSNSTTAFSGVISGSGGLEKEGNGNLYLTGANTYTGGTTISSGGVVIGSGGATGSITGNVVDNGRLFFDRSNDSSFMGSISGTGLVEQIGTGMTTLSGANTYTGLTFVKRGTLAAGAANAFSAASEVSVNAGATLVLNGFDQSTGSVSGSGTVILGGAVLSEGADDRTTTFAGTISGSGAFQKIGNGNLYLTNTNTYSGGTTISSGGLVLGSGAVGGSIAGDVVNNSRFYFGRSDVFTFSGSISGSGNVFQIGTGTTTLTGANTYSGGTTISAGTLEATSNSSLGTATVALNGGALLLDDGVNLSNEVDVNAASFIDVDGTDTATISGALVGSAPFEKDGTGTLILDHDNSATYSGNISYHGTLTAGVTGAFGTGTVTVLGSVLDLMNGIDDTTPTVLADDLSVTVDHGSATISGTISQSGGPWGLTKKGNGTLVIDAADSYTGGTLVEAGVLDVAGSLTSIVTVGPGAALEGNGTIAGLVAEGGAKVAPGASIGTLNVAGDVSFATGSAYQVEINPTQADEIVATGAATLSGGTVSVVAAPGNYAAGTTFTILSATGGVTGTFASVTSDLTVLVPTLVYKPSEVDLTLAFKSLASFGSTANERAVADAIDADRTSAFYGRVATLPAGAMPAAFDASSGEIHASLASVLLMNGASLRQGVLDRLHDVNHDSDSPVLWGRLFGSWGGIASDGNAASIDTTFAGPTVGADIPVAENLRLGGEVGYAQSQGFIAARGSSLEADATHVGVYGRYGDGALSLEAGVIGSFGNARTTRSIRFAGVSETAHAKQSARTTQAFAEAGYDIPLDNLDLEPFLDGGWIEAETGSFAETGGFDALAASHASTAETFTTLGARLATTLTASDGTAITPTARFGWMHLYDGLDPARRLFFETTNAGFTLAGVPLDQDQAIVEAGLVFSPLADLDLDLGYDAVLSSRTRSSQLHANLDWRM